MHWLPYRRLSFRTSLSVEQVQQHLLKNITEVKLSWASFKRPTTLFKGKLEGNQFKISRVINYKNSFLPFIDGQIDSSGSSTKISLRMALHPFVKIFGIVWLLGFIGGGAPLVIGGIRNSDFQIFMIAFSLMAVLFYLVVILTFNYEVKKARTLLLDILEGRDIEEE